MKKAGYMDRYLVFLLYLDFFPSNQFANDNRPEKSPDIKNTQVITFFLASTPYFDVKRTYYKIHQNLHIMVTLRIHPI